MSTKPIGINADAGDPEYAAVDWRRSQAMLLTHGVADGLGARAGVRPGGTAAFTLSGTTVNVLARPVVVYPGESSTDGPYVGHLMPDTHTLDPADGSNPRIDIVIVRVYDDDHDSSGRRELVTEYLVGSPSASPVPPAVPSGAFAALEVSVPAGGSPSPSATYVAPFAVASGGVLPVRDDGERPAGGLYDGMTVWRQDTHGLEVFDGSDWAPVGPRSDESSTTGAIEISGGTTNPVDVQNATVVVGGSGVVAVEFAFRFEDSTASTAGRAWRVSARLSGANTLNEHDTPHSYAQWRSGQFGGSSFYGSATERFTRLYRGLNPGSTTVTIQASASSEAFDMDLRRLTVVAL